MQLGSSSGADDFGAAVIFPLGDRDGIPVLAPRAKGNEAAVVLTFRFATDPRITGCRSFRRNVSRS